jgi:hypothetical protein
VVSLQPAVTQQYSLGPVKSWVAQAAYFLGPRHGIKNIGGWRRSDPFPDHPSGHALDFMVPDTATGDSLAADAIVNARPLGIKYIIWNRRSWNPQRGTWVPYTSTSNPHTDHVHITFNDSPGTGVPGGAIPVGLGTTGGNSTTDDTCAWSFGLPSPVPGVTVTSNCILSKVQVRAIVGVGFIGGALVVGLVASVVMVAFALKSSGAQDAATQFVGYIPGGRYVAGKVRGSGN